MGVEEQDHAGLVARRVGVGQRDVVEPVAVEIRHRQAPAGAGAGEGVGGVKRGGQVAAARRPGIRQAAVARVGKADVPAVAGDANAIASTALPRRALWAGGGAQVAAGVGRTRPGDEDRMAKLVAPTAASGGAARSAGAGEEVVVGGRAEAAGGREHASDESQQLRRPPFPQGHHVSTAPVRPATPRTASPMLTGCQTWAELWSLWYCA